LNPNLIYLSHATYVGPSGATAAATYAFFTKDLKSPAEPRAIDKDIVVNQNGKFKYIYDNGPGFRQFPPFSILCEARFEILLGGGPDTQYARLREMWEHRGLLGLKVPDGTYTIAWSSDLDQNFRVFPITAGATQIEREIVVQFEEAQ
jgi:hypothetical protein